MTPEEEEEQQSKRPKVVDKRISAGGHAPERPKAPPEPAPVQPEPPAAAPPPPPASPAAGPPGEAPVWTPEQEDQARQMIEEIVRVPSLDWVLNAAVNLANVAGTKIEMGAAADAQLAIDAFAALVNGLSAASRTLEACLPLGPSVTSNSTACPSWRDL
jgi:hypothetical protein